MVDLIGFAILGIFVPTLLLALASAVAILFWSLVMRAKPKLGGLSKALWGSIKIELLSLFVGGPILAIGFGKELSYGLPIVVVLITLLLGILNFVYFMVKGVPNCLTIYRR